MSSTSEIESQKSKLLRSTLHPLGQLLIRCLFAIGVLYLLVRWFITANCTNHLVVINDGQVDPVRLEEATLVHPSPSACWTQSINLSLGQGRENFSSLSVLDIDHAWFGGTLILSDDNGSEWISLDLSPPGRCGRTLVVHLDSTGNVKTQWSALPR